MLIPLPGSEESKIVEEICAVFKKYPKYTYSTKESTIDKLVITITDAKDQYENSLC